MAFKLIWSPAARDDLHDIVVFIARDNPNRAMSFGYELISETDRLQEFPELGRSVPEWLCLKSQKSLSDRVSTGSGSDLVSDQHAIFPNDS